MAQKWDLCRKVKGTGLYAWRRGNLRLI
jgi:hypothetical protein